MDALVIPHQQDRVMCIEGEPCESSLAHYLLRAQRLYLVVGEIEHLRIIVSLSDNL